jgi:polyisoprenoid-binding protein YceI
LNIFAFGQEGEVGLMRRLAVVAAATIALAVPILGQTPAGQPAPAGAWQVDPAHSAAHFSVKHMMVSTVRGTLGKVTGTIDYDGTSVQGIKADVTIDVAAVNTGNDSRDSDLRSPNFFDVAKYPTITFKSKRVETAGQGKFRMIGDLTMHGVTKEVTLDVEGPSPILKPPTGPQRVGAAVTATLNRRDYGLQYSRMIEAAPVVGDEIQVQVDIEATKR